MTTIADRSVQSIPPYEERPRSSLVLTLATVADDVPAWGRDPALRDHKLREFWPTEPVLASGIYSIVIRNASFSWTLDGPPRTVKATLDILHNANMGEGWLTFISQWLTDWLSQDNGAFIEVIRAGEGAESPVIGIAHLDSARCRRTGMLDFPVVYWDRMGRQHKLAAHQVVCSSDFPSPVETMNGVGLCAVSRVLRAAQLLRDIGIYLREKVAGRNPAAIHLVSGIKASEIEDAMTQHRDYQGQKGLMRYDLPLVLATLDPTATISHETLELAALPDSFDLDTTMRWYINQLALGFGADYQDFAPLPGRGIGSSTQSMILHEKSRGKGPALFMKTVTHLFNFHGVIARNVTFRYDEQDAAADLEQADLRLQQAQTDALYLTAGVLTPGAVRQRMLDDGEISQEQFDALQAPEGDLTADVTADEDEAVENKAAGDAGKVYRLLAKSYPPEVLGWAKDTAGDWAYRARVPLADIKMSRRPGGRDPEKVAAIAEAIARGDKMDPVVLVATADGLEIADGYHRTLAFQREKKATIAAWVGTGFGDHGPWETEMHAAKLNKAKGPFADDERRRFEAEMTDAMASALGTVQALMRRRILGRKAFVFKAMPNDLPDDPAFWLDMSDELKAAMAPYPQRIGLGAGEANIALGFAIDMDLVNQGVLDYSRTYIDDWWREIEATTRNGMRQAIVNWQATGLGKRGLPDLVDALEPLFGQARARRIAVTEVTRLFQNGTDLALRSAGIESTIWTTVRDERVCSICGPLDGEIRPIGQGMTPPAHVQCRCMRVGVANNPELRFS